MAKKRPREPKPGAAVGQHRKPVAGAPVEAKRTPIPGAPLGGDPTIIWGLSLIDLDGPWGWAQVTAAQATKILAKVREWERQRASEFFGGGGSRGNKLIPLEHLSASARARLVERGLDDEDGLWELHQSGKERIWGIRREHIFYALWWDPEHTVCPSKKR